MTITFLGHGYVGLVTAAVFADLGNTVWVIGHTAEKIENLKKGILPIYEPGLEEIVKRNVKAGRLLFTLDYDKAIPSSDVVFIAVGTPPKSTGEADLSVVFEVAEKIAKNLTHYTVVVTKSTVPVGTNKEVQKIINKAKGSDITFDIASCPEFLREGQAIGDTEHPDRIVIGTESKKAEEVLVELHKPITGERVLTNIETAEMIKYAANAFLATKISFANAIAQLSEKAGANAVEVLKAIGEDKRIGKYFLNAGAGYGGSCFPKDVKALIAIAKGYGYDFKLLRDVEEINKDAMQLIVEKVTQRFNGNVAGKTIGILGLSFKPDTDDMRDAPAIVVIKALESLGAKIKGYDPISMDNAKRLLPTITLCKDAYEVCQDADAVVLMTEWNEFKELDLKKIKSSLKTPVFIDGRNVYEPEKMKNFGFDYSGVGR
ncbi:MAG TPA: UDP-glucose/GDP-mannose dehydrogenase family protein [Candidatus Saccharimonadales bacterium]|nr:UDP-glucose/GDP-mannose dehydrogenase family protein [Candidatus Saccharimonadales bacterium]